MASGKVDHCRYEKSDGAINLSATVSFHAGTNVNITANDFGKPSNPSGYTAFFCGVYANSSALVVRYIQPQNNGTNNLVSIRNVGTGALNNIDIYFKYLYLRNDMIDDQRS